ncbi:bifunctional diguanylate cyclase/phosphodiesterase [Vogesella oryzae]|uniref:bifunctional diguanylate cyclase/phosphodiesterase n=1 Tax=Vogesella oryzae TaxID=1735285 RepID=UPI00158147D7|nr:EAL domain-containing protein [Vogesella oryzae]
MIQLPAMPPSATKVASKLSPLQLAVRICILIGALLLLQLVFAGWLRLPDYAAIHTLLEIMSIAMSLLVAVMSWFKTDSSRRLRVMAIGFMVVAGLDILHTVSYPVLPAFLGLNTPHKAIVLWLGARSAVALAMLFLLLPERNQRSAAPLLLVYGLLFAVLGVAYHGSLPLLFVPGQGLSPLKVLLEWLLVGSYLLLAWRIQRAGPAIAAGQWLAAGLLVLAFGELFFCFYQLVDDLANGLGHVFKVIGQAFFLRGVIETRLLQPYQQLNIEKAAHEDALGRLNALVAGAPLGILVVDAGGVITSSNHTAESMFLAEPEALDGLLVEELVAAELQAKHVSHRVGYYTAPQIKRMSERQGLQAVRRDGSKFYVNVALAPLQWGGRMYTLAFVSDVSAEVQQNLQLQWLADHDELTSLPNRRATLERLAAVVKQPGQGALLVLNIDALGRINQVFGHRVGDELLVACSQRLKSMLMPGEEIMRLQGDSFAVIMSGESWIEARGELLLAAFDHPFQLGDEVSLQASASAGYSRFPQDSQQPDQLLQYAELAMAAAKRSGQHGLKAFNPAQPAKTRRWLELASQMPAGLRQDEFYLVYQPRITLDDSQVAGFEVLVRWQPPSGSVSPGEFIPVAEETGFILELGRWIFERALAQLAAWQREGVCVGRLAINLSTRQLSDSGLPEFLLQCCTRHGIEPSQLELEITETAAMENLEWALPVLQQLRFLGLYIALDDFGTGYSSLAYLQQLPVSVLKIDLAFVRNLDREEGRAVARTIITLAQNMGCSTVAEGVETESQKAWLLANHCDEMQGFLEAKPLPVEAVAPYLQHKRAAGQQALQL